MAIDQRPSPQPHAWATVEPEDLPDTTAEFHPRLFDVPTADDVTSEDGPVTATDHHVPCPSQTGTPPLSPIQTPPPDHGGVADPILAAVAMASADVATANAALDRAIAAARQEGHSWRVIANAAQIPHQTLHRRERRSVTQQERG